MTRFRSIPLLLTVGFLAPVTFLPAQEPAGGPGPSNPAPLALPLPNASVPKNRKINLLPNEKRPFFLKEDERNPFARRNPDVDLITEATEQETEAELIRNALNALSITGRSRGPNGLRVLADGNLIFERGKVLEPVIEGQTEALIVEEVTETQINLAWINDDTGKLTGKSVIMTYDLTPKVRMVMKGQRFSQSSSGAERGSPKLIEVAFDRKPRPDLPIPRNAPAGSQEPPRGLAAESRDDHEAEEAAP